MTYNTHIQSDVYCNQYDCRNREEVELKVKYRNITSAFSGLYCKKHTEQIIEFVKHEDSHVVLSHRPIN